MHAGQLFLLALCPIAVSVLIRSYVPPGSQCNSTAGTHCFAEMYSQMHETCNEKRVGFKCVHYTFLNKCFEQRVGRCSAEAVGNYADEGFKLATSQCAPDAHRRKDGTIPMLGSPRKELPNHRQLMASLGFLQLQCSLSRHNNCSSEHIHNIISQCEETMKPTAGYSSFDRHRLLRIKLDTSRKLMTYQETDKERECLVVRSIFSELYALHHEHCHHSIVTRCLCERQNFNQECSIDCDQLEATAPNQNELAWDEWKRARLIRSSARTSPFQICSLLCILLLLFGL